MVEVNDAGETREPLRGLVDTIRVIPEEGQLRIAVPGELGAILRLAERPDGGRIGECPGVEAEALVERIKLYAGTGSHRQLLIACRS